MTDIDSRRSFRSPSEAEVALLKSLVTRSFKGAPELLRQLERILVRRIDDNGSLELCVQMDIVANVSRRIPIEAEMTVSSGVTIHVLLHVLQGKAIELEIYQDDLSRVIELPSPSMLRFSQEARTEKGDRKGGHHGSVENP